MTRYKHIIDAERIVIQKNIRAGKTQKETAGELGRSKGTISRELKRNRSEDGFYRAYEAGQKAGERRKREKLDKQGDPLIKMKSVIEWETFRPIFERAEEKEAKGPGGRPPYDGILKFKTLILQRLYNIPACCRQV